MAWIYLAESADSPLPWRHGCGHSPTVKTTDTRKELFSLALLAVNYPGLPSGTMSKLSTEVSGETLSTSSTAVSLARTSALRDLELAWKESEADFSSKSSGSLKKFAPLSSSLKMSQQSAHADLHAFSLSSPLYGMTVDGQLFQPQRLELRTLEKDGSYLPTPTASAAGTNGKTKCKNTGRWVNGRPSLSMMATRNLWPTPRASASENRQTKPTPSQLAGKHGRSLVAEVGGQLNPTWVEWLMGYPTGWTVLEDWATLWFRPKRAPRSKD